MQLTTFLARGQATGRKLGLSLLLGITSLSSWSFSFPNSSVHLNSLIGTSYQASSDPTALVFNTQNFVSDLTSNRNIIYGVGADYTWDVHAYSYPQSHLQELRHKLRLHQLSTGAELAYQQRRINSTTVGTLTESAPNVSATVQAQSSNREIIHRINIGWINRLYVNDAVFVKVSTGITLTHAVETTTQNLVSTPTIAPNHNSGSNTNGNNSNSTTSSSVTLADDTNPDVSAGMGGDNNNTSPQPDTSAPEVNNPPVADTPIEPQPQPPKEEVVLTPQNTFKELRDGLITTFTNSSARGYLTLALGYDIGTVSTEIGITYSTSASARESERSALFSYYIGGGVTYRF